MSDVESNRPEFQQGKNEPLPKLNGGASPDNVVPMPPKKTGLTLESLKQATVKSGTPPLTAIKSTAVIIDVRKPEKGVPFRAHPDEAYAMDGYSLTVKQDGVIGETVWLVHPTIATLIHTFVRYQRFCLCWDAWKRKPFIWPVNIEAEGERLNSWVTSANRILGAARASWVCLVPMAGAYQLGKPVASVEGEARWPVEPFDELMLLAFRDLYLGPDDRDHKEVVKRMINIIPE
jgi:hypothetical protein